MFPYKSYFERHYILGYSLLISSIVGIPFCFKYSRWLQTEEGMYDYTLRNNCNVLELFNLFIKEYVKTEYKNVKENDAYSYKFTINENMIDLEVQFETRHASKMIEAFKVFPVFYELLNEFEEGHTDVIGKEGFIDYAMQYFSINREQASFIWNCLFSKADNRATDRWIKGVHSQQLEPVQFVQPQQDVVPSPDATNEHAL